MQVLALSQHLGRPKRRKVILMLPFMVRRRTISSKRGIDEPLSRGWQSQSATAGLAWGDQY